MALSALIFVNNKQHDIVFSFPKLGCSLTLACAIFILLGVWARKRRSIAIKRRLLTA